MWRWNRHLLKVCDLNEGNSMQLLQHTIEEKEWPHFQRNARLTLKIVNLLLIYLFERSFLAASHVPDCEKLHKLFEFEQIFLFQSCR